MQESKKLKPQTLKKTLYNPSIKADKKKKMQFTQNWKVKNKNETRNTVNYDFLLSENKRAEKEIKES